MAQEHGDALQRHAGQQKLNRKRVPESVREAPRDAGQREQLPQAPLPIADSALGF